MGVPLFGVLIPLPDSFFKGVGVVRGGFIFNNTGHAFRRISLFMRPKLDKANSLSSSIEI